MFAGRYEYTLDDKSRVSIPSKFRETLSARYDYEAHAHKP
jgi:DNA-binding transcriptional regulator/RsmH inhibitor MraZ